MLEQKPVSESGKSEEESARQEHVSTEEERNRNEEQKYYLRGLAFLVLLVLTTLVITLMYMFLHDINPIRLFTQSQRTWAFGFIGGSKNPASIGAEIWTWCLVGVSCRFAYLSGRAIIRKQFQFLRYLTYWISTCLLAWGVAVAVILSLQVISLSIADVEITLANASIETIVAISFIMGFYHDEARRLLGSLRGRIVRGMEDETRLPEEETEERNKPASDLEE